jgi:HAD superfamily hydrolase (TIGR01509 family)
VPAELQAVLFDLDGTLVDTEGLWWRACSEVADRLGHALTAADVEHVHGRPAEHVAAHLMTRRRGRHRPEAVADMLTDAFADRVTQGVTVLPGALPLLDALAAAGVPAALVTASPRRIAETALRDLGAHRFRLTVTAEDVRRNKPAPDPYLEAAARLAVDPAACVAVEDSPTGAAAAGAAGCAVLLVAGTLERVDLPLLRGLVARHQAPGPAGAA